MISEVQHHKNWLGDIAKSLVFIYKSLDHTNLLPVFISGTSVQEYMRRVRYLERMSPILGGWREADKLSQISSRIASAVIQLSQSLETSVAESAENGNTAVLAKV